VNCTLLGNHDHWEFGRLRQFEMVTRWIGLTNSPPVPQIVESEKPATDSAQPPRGVSATAVIAGGRMDAAARVDHARNFSRAATAVQAPVAPLHLFDCAQIYFKDLSRALGPVSLVLALAGLWNWYPLLRHRDKSPLAMVGALLLLAIWIRLATVGNINSRYFLVVLFVAVPFEALGCLDAIAWIGRRHVWQARFRKPEMAAAVSLLSLLLLAGWIDGLMAHHKERDAQLILGDFLRTSSHSSGNIVSDLGAARACYSIHDSLPVLIWPEELLTDEFDRRPPDLVVFSRDYLPLDRQQAIVDRAANLGLQLVDAADLPRTETIFVVLMRDPPQKRVAAYAPAGSTPFR
jgi:hypothetical protein